MSTQGDSTGGRLLRGALAGLVAGVAASFVIDRFQAGLTALSSPEGGSEEEPSTQRAADSVAKALTGSDLADADKPLAGQAAHYALGISLGVAYGIAAAFRPFVTVGSGAAMGVAVATLLDEGVVPAMGFGKAPWKTSASSHFYSYASHLVFGVSAELVRSQVSGTLRH